VAKCGGGKFSNFLSLKTSPSFLNTQQIEAYFFMLTCCSKIKLDHSTKNSAVSYHFYGITLLFLPAMVSSKTRSSYLTKGHEKQQGSLNLIKISLFIGLKKVKFIS